MSYYSFSAPDARAVVVGPVPVGALAHPPPRGEELTWPDVKKGLKNVVWAEYEKGVREWLDDPRLADLRPADLPIDDDFPLTHSRFDDPPPDPETYAPDFALLEAVRATSTGIMRMLLDSDEYVFSNRGLRNALFESLFHDNSALPILLKSDRTKPVARGYWLLYLAVANARTNAVELLLADPRFPVVPRVVYAALDLDAAAELAKDEELAKDGYKIMALLIEDDRASEVTRFLPKSYLKKVERYLKRLRKRKG